MNISNENGGGSAGADYALNPNLKYSPYIYFRGDITF